MTRVAPLHTVEISILWDEYVACLIGELGMDLVAFDWRLTTLGPYDDPPRIDLHVEGPSDDAALERIIEFAETRALLTP